MIVVTKATQGKKITHLKQNFGFEDCLGATIARAYNLHAVLIANFI